MTGLPRWSIVVSIAMLNIGLWGCEEHKVTAVSEPPATQPSGAATAGEQTVCPVSDFEIDKAVFVEHEGKKVYFCCEGCIETFQKEPATYLAKLPQFGGKEAPSKGKMPM